MHRYTPPRINRAGIIIPLFLFGAAAICMFFAVSGLANRLILQLITVICLTAGIQITARYRLCSFTYIIDERPVIRDTDPDAIGAAYGQEFGTPALSVVRTQGKYGRTVAVLPLSGIVDVVNSRAEAEKKHSDIKYHYNYCVNLFPRAQRTVVFVHDDRKAAISLEPDDVILNYLMKSDDN
ncbi:MAG: hypothetical protein PHZ09_07425 [Eubacteriales bacterium]|jgi:hypothetical protein|nr:hypothetical protein [Eubacteriales bacterium]